MNLDRIKAGLEDAIAFKKGDTTRGVAHVPETIDVSEIRNKLGMTRENLPRHARSTSTRSATESKADATRLGRPQRR